jgi:hypothetical protein
MAVMPNFNFTTEQAQSLSMLVLSWRRHTVPARYLAGAPRTDPRTPEELRAEAEMKTGPGAWFVQTGCFVCHSVSSLGVKSPAQIGPDLSIAIDDVQKRFGVTIDDFLNKPTGTMSVVLSRQIILTPEQKQLRCRSPRSASTPISASEVIHAPVLLEDYHERYSASARMGIPTASFYWRRCQLLHAIDAGGRDRPQAAEPSLTSR